MPVALMTTLPAGRPARISSLALPDVVLYIFKLNDGCAGDRDAFQHQAQARQPRCRAVDNDDALGAVSATTLLDNVQRQRRSRAARAEHEQMAAAATELARAEDGVQAEAAGDGIGRPANQLAVIFGDAGDFLPCLRVGAEGVEQVGSGRQQVDLVRGHLRTQRQRFPPDVRNNLPLTRRRGVDWEIDAHQRRDED